MVPEICKKKIHHFFGHPVRNLVMIGEGTDTMVIRQLWYVLFLLVSRGTNYPCTALKRPIIIPHGSGFDRDSDGLIFYPPLVNKSKQTKIKCFRAGLFSVNQNFRLFYCFFFHIFCPKVDHLDLSVITQEIAIFVTIVVSLERSRRCRSFGACHY